MQKCHAQQKLVLRHTVPILGCGKSSRFLIEKPENLFMRERGSGNIVLISTIDSIYARIESDGYPCTIESAFHDQSHYILRYLKHKFKEDIYFDYTKLGIT